MRDPIATVARLRRMARDDARQALAQGLAAEAAAAAAAAAATRRIQEEEGIAADVQAGDAVVEAFAAWLPGARDRQAAARAACDRAGAEVDRLRAVLTASRTAAEAVETLIADRANRLQAALDQREAHDLADARPAAPD